MVALRTPPPQVALDLTLAVTASSNAPLLLLQGDLAIIAASDSFCRIFDLNPNEVAGRPIFDLGAGEWDLPQLRSLLSSTASGLAEVEAYEIDLTRPHQDTRRLVLNARKLDYADEDNIRLLMSLSDVTDARASEKLKDNLLREKAILLQELQHRVANSLQIIASVLMQSARKVQSEETRSHLYEAHHRVMSVAAVQQHLAPSRLGHVALRAYFTELCQSIGASMIRDHDQLSLEVSGDDSVTDADVSVSLGLIVTELVINALKHAFPGHRKGRITVDYRSLGSDWTLSIGDDGIGMPTEPKSSSGLGTNIVEAIAKQLEARIEVVGAHPGTMVSVVHAHAAAPVHEAA